MRLERLELRRVGLELVVPFRTGSGVETHRNVLLVHVTTDHGDGWGECVALSEPTYTAEYVDAAQMVIGDHLWPTLAAAGDVEAGEVARVLDRFVGHPMAKAALEMAVLDAQLRADGTNLRTLFGVDRDLVPSGVSVGLFPTIDDLLAQVQAYLDDGYARIKLKIVPGHDIEPVRHVRDLVGPEVGLQVDANAAYERTDIEHLCRLDEFNLLLIEQPLPADDLLGHTQLAGASSTPVCLDESIVSVNTTRDAIALGAAEVVNIKPGRVGGFLAARRIHDLCFDQGVPVWCGGMLETGLGRAANVALAALPGFTLPGDISASSRFYARDVVVDPITVEDGHVRVPDGPGLGFEIDHDVLDSVTIEQVELGA